MSLYLTAFRLSHKTHPRRPKPRHCIRTSRFIRTQNIFRSLRTYQHDNSSYFCERMLPDCRTVRAWSKVSSISIPRDILGIALGRLTTLSHLWKTRSCIPAILHYVPSSCGLTHHAHHAMYERTCVLVHPMYRYTHTIQITQWHSKTVQRRHIFHQRQTRLVVLITARQGRR